MMSTLEITSAVATILIQTLVTIAKTSMFLEYRIPKTAGIVFLTVFGITASVVTAFSSDTNVEFFATVLQTVLTPVVFSLCCRSWLTAVSEIYVYNIVFRTLPAAVISLLAPAEYVASIDSSYGSIAFSSAVLAVTNMLSIIAYKHRWLKEINEKICISVYIIAFYFIRVIASSIDEKMLDQLSDRVITAVIAAFCVVAMMSTLIIPELMFKRQQNEEAASRAELNSFICRHIAEQNTAIRAFRHDLANHLQVADSGDAGEILRHRDRVAEIVDSYSSPPITADSEVNAILAQTKQLCLSSGMDFSVNWVNPPSEFTAEQCDNLLYRLAEMYCDSMNENPNTKILLTAEGYEIALQSAAKQNGVQ